MARFNEILVGRYNRFLQRLLGMKGGPPAAQLASEIGSEFVVDDAQNLELRFLAGWRSYGSALTVAAGGAGNRAAVRFVNPSGSGVLAVIEKITVSDTGVASPNDLPFLNRGPAGTISFPGPVSGTLRDLRIGSGAGSTCQLSASGNAGPTVGATMWNANVLANASIDVILYQNQEILVVPNDALTVYCNNLNQGITVTFFFRERAQEEGEVSA